MVGGKGGSSGQNRGSEQCGENSNKIIKKEFSAIIPYFTILTINTLVNKIGNSPQLQSRNLILPARSTSALKQTLCNGLGTQDMSSTLEMERS